MKRFIAIIIFLLMGLPSSSMTLQGGVVYTVETARQAAFEGIKYEISMEPYQKYMTDPGFIAPGEGGKKPKVSKKGRWVTYFDDGEYAISYYSEKRTYYYDKNGKLYIVEIHNENETYPCIDKQYDTKGQLKHVVFRTKNNEQYIYDKNKKLLGHWKQNIGYDEDGNIVDRRNR